jgi:hypothetical protein
MIALQDFGRALAAGPGTRELQAAPLQKSLANH